MFVPYHFVRGDTRKPLGQTDGPKEKTAVTRGDWHKDIVANQTRYC
jgi:hypothetical protein